MPGLVTCLKRPPGSSKTLLSTSIIAALLPQLKGRERILFLTKIRKQRMNALRLGRRIFSNPMLALGVGRSVTEESYAVEYGE